MNDIERTSLDAHVSLCALRYQALDDRLTRVEHSLTELNALVREVHDKLSQTQKAQWGRWDKVQWSLIASLSGIVGWLIVSGVLK